MYLKKKYEYFMACHERKIINSILEIEDFKPIVNVTPKKINKICFVISSLKAYAGGHTSILRLGTNLSKKGIEIYYVYLSNQKRDTLEKIAEKNLNNYCGEFINYSKAQEIEFDVCIATSWYSVFWAKKLYGYKVYFVQDYEPYFFKVNERYLLAKKTYEMGFHIISLGKWNLKQIQKNCMVVGKLDSIDFPYEPSEYEKKKRNYQDYAVKKKFNIAVYTKEEGKRIPNLIQKILCDFSEKMSQSYNIKIDINFFGLDKKYKVKVGRNLGKLNKKELVDLYNHSDFGVVASMTNISLVPYEMIATGLPVIEFKDGSFSEFFPDKSAILIDYNSEELLNKIILLLKDTTKIEQMMLIAQKSIDKLSWENSSNQFYEILLSLL